MTKRATTRRHREAPGQGELALALAKALGDLSPTRRYLIGVSGGRDSIALLHMLVNAGYGRLTVCHLDHRLRPRSSRADARFVSTVAADLGLRCEIAASDVRGVAAEKKMSLETAARACRYDFFARVAKKTRCHTILLGHHADDLVETFLLNLFRGAGITGIAAMRRISRRDFGSFELTIVRPLLAMWRAEINNYVSQHRLRFRDDISNESLQPTRNRIRHLVLPYLEKSFGRKLRRNIWRTAMIAAEEEHFFDLLLPPAMRSDLAVKPLRKMPTALQRRTLHRWLRDANLPEVGFDLIERIRELLDLTGRVAKTNLPRDRHVRRRAGKLFIE